MVNFSYLHYNVIQRGCELISGMKRQSSPKLRQIHPGRILYCYTSQLKYVLRLQENASRAVG